MVTTLYAGLLGLIYLALSAYVICGRWKHKVNIGNGNHENLEKRIRAHSNFIEYVPIALILIFLAEIEGASEILIHILGLMLVVGRSIHPFGLIRVVGLSIGRTGGMILTLSAILIAALYCIQSFFIF